jgi:hypothetical protein
LNATVVAFSVDASATVITPTISALTIFRDVDWTFGRAVQ